LKDLQTFDLLNCNRTAPKRINEIAKRKAGLPDVYVSVYVREYVVKGKAQSGSQGMALYGRFGSSDYRVYSETLNVERRTLQNP
jgi:hypothetical protein